MNFAKLFCLILFLIGTIPKLAETHKASEEPNTPDTTYQMTEAEVKLLADTKAYLDAGGKVDAIDDDGKTRLHKAVSNSYKILTEFLIEHGANVNAQDEYGLTPLHLAARSNTISIAKLLIANGADVNIKHQIGIAPLHFAASLGRKAMVELLINSGADVNIRDNRLQTPLHKAADKGFRDIAELLIANGADINAKDEKGKAPLDLATEHGQKDVAKLLTGLVRGHEQEVRKIHDAASQGDLGLVKSVIAENPKLANARDDKDATPLHTATLAGHKDVVEFLIASGADINAKDKDDSTPLLIAVVNDRVDLVKLFIKNEANLNMKCAKGFAPIHFAARKQNSTVLQALIKAGADVGTKDSEGWTPLHHTAACGTKEVAEILLEKGANVNAQGGSGEIPLHIAAGGNLPVAEILIGKRADINAKAQGETPLHVAATAGQEKIVELLIKNGANITAEDDKGNTPENVASQNGHKKIVSLIQEHTPAHTSTLFQPLKINKDEVEAKVLAETRAYLQSGGNVEAADKNGDTRLHRAAELGYYTVAEFLVRNRANVNSENELGYTPTYMAILEGHNDIAKFLINAGAKNENKIGYPEKKETTLLHLAAGCGAYEIAQLLISKGTDVNAKDEKGLTPLHWAVTSLNTEAAHLLINNGANVNSRDKENLTPLYRTVEFCRPSMIKLLIEKGAVDDRVGINSLHRAVLKEDATQVIELIKSGVPVETRDSLGNTALHYAAGLADTNMTELLIAKGADVNARTPQRGLTPLSIAAYSGQLGNSNVLIAHGADINAQSENGKTPLFDAVNGDHVRVADLLLAKGAKVNTVDSWGYTPLHSVKSKAMVELLLANGANLEACNKSQTTPLCEAVQWGRYDVATALIAGGANIDAESKVGSVLEIALRQQNRTLAEFLVAKGADINHKSGHWRSLLHKAVSADEIGEVELLLRLGADMEARDVVEGTPLNSAVHSGNEGIVRLLIEGGANPNAKDGFGDSPLHFAIRKDPMARRDRIALLKILIEGGANLNSKNKLGFTPLHEAVMQGETAIVRILIEGGADINVGDSSGSTPLDFALHDNNKELVETLRNSGAKTKEPSPEDKIFFTLSLVDRNTRKEKTVVEEFGTVDDKLLPDGVARPIFLENDLYIVRVAVQGFEGEPIRLFLLNEQTNEVMKTFIEEVVPKPSEAGGGTGWMRGGTVEGVQKSMKVMLRLEVGKLSKEKHLVFLPEKTTTDKAIPRFKESNTISSTGDLDSELKTILVHLKNPNKTIRLGAFIELEKLNSEKKRKILPLLIKMIETADEDMKDKLIFAICDFGKDAKEAFVPLLQLLRESINENKTDRQFMIINVMADIGRPEATPVMAELLRSKDHKVSNAVIVTLKKLGPNARPAIPKLIEIAKSPDLCEDVLLILPKIGLLETEAQAASIVDLLESDNCDGFAMFTLIEIGKTLAIPALVEKLSSPKKTTRLYAVRTLGEIGRASGDLRVLPALRSALLQEHDERVIMEIKLYIIKLTLTPVR